MWLDALGLTMGGLLAAAGWLLLGWVLWRQRLRWAAVDRDRLLAFVDSTPDLIATANADLSIAYLNPAGRRLTGWREESLAGHTVCQLHPPWAREIVLQCGLPAALRDGSWTGETVLLDADGHQIPMSQTLVCHRADNGRTHHLSITMREIGAFKRGQEALLSSEERLRQAVQVARCGIFEHDHLRNTIFSSPEHRQLHGFGADEQVTMQMLDHNLHPEDREKVRTAIVQAHDPSGDGLLNFECRIRALDGSEHWIEARARTLFAGEGSGRHPVRTVGAVSDVTDRRLAEEHIRRLNAELEQRVRARTAELEAAVRELEAFSYSVSHDLRAPLRGIDGLALALAERCADRLDDTGRDHLKHLRQYAARMGRLIDDLLNLARVSSGALAQRDCDLSLLARSVACNLRKEQPARSATVAVQPGLQAWADVGLMRVVLQNLIGNAWKYSSPKPQAQIEFGLIDALGEPVYFVRDNGVGFDMVHVAKLFTAFQRLHSEQQFEGTGIGLATVRRIVERHGGRVWAESQAGRGSCFYFTLGARCREEAAAAATVAVPVPVRAAAGLPVQT